MRIEIRSDSVDIDGYVNAVARDSRPIRDKKTGTRFIEQIVPKVFTKALERADEVMLLLNHENDRVLGSSKNNLQLYEDAIGLRAHAVVTDPEVIEKARKHELRGWSFGFIPKDVSVEDAGNGIERRFVEDMDLIEVSIIDTRKLPVYEGTSIEARAESERVEDENATSEVLDTRAEYVEQEPQKKPVDFSDFKARILALEH